MLHAQAALLNATYGLAKSNAKGLFDLSSLIAVSPRMRLYSQLDTIDQVESIQHLARGS